MYVSIVQAKQSNTNIAVMQINKSHLPKEQYQHLNYTKITYAMLDAYTTDKQAH
mgnify:CR=1 FL=1